MPVADEHAVVASFSEELCAPLGAKGYSHASVHTGFIYRIRTQSLICRNVQFCGVAERSVSPVPVALKDIRAALKGVKRSRG